MSRLDHPGYFAFIPACGTFPGALADFMASALNIYVGSWMEAAGPSRLELIVLDWFKRWIGYPSEAAGSLVSGGSAANITALACAREALLGAMNDRVVVYVADQAHSSIARAARLLGFRPDQVRVLPTDGSHRLQPETVVAAIEADANAGRQPLFVSAAAGSTNTGAVDPLAELARGLPRARRLAARRRRVRGLRRAQRPGPRAPRRPRAGRLGDARPAQVALSAVSSAARCSSATAGTCAAPSRSCPTT